MSPHYVQLFLLFLHNAFYSLGVATLTTSGIRRQVVERWHALSEEEFDVILQRSKRLPGVLVLNLAVQLSYRLRGGIGAVVGVCGALLPACLGGLFAVLIMRWASGTPLWDKFWMGVRPAAFALLLIPCFKLGRSAGVSLATVWLPVMVAVTVVLFHVSPFLIVVVMALLGFGLGFFLRSRVGKD